MNGSESFDGSMADLYERLTDWGESVVVHEAVPAGASILELGCGTGRMTRRLLELGHSVTAVDNDPEMLRHVPAEAENVLGQIETLNLAEHYPVVLMASNLINHPDPAVRLKLLRTCRRHTADDGVVVLQRYDPQLTGWDNQEWAKRGSVEIRVAALRREGNQFAATIEYRDGDQHWSHHFKAVLLDDETFRHELLDADLRFMKTLDREGSLVLASPPSRLVGGVPEH